MPSLAALGFWGLISVAVAGPRPVMPETLDLPQTISLAFEKNFAIRQARERIRAQEGIITTVSAAALPSVSYQRPLAFRLFKLARPGLIGAWHELSPRWAKNW